MTQSPRLNLPYIAPSQAQKHVTHNEALGRLDALVQLSILAQVATPPEGVEEGDMFIISPPATGAFSGHEKGIAAFQDGAWLFLTPAAGWRAWRQDAGALFVFDGTDWEPVSYGGPVQHTALGINTVPDAAARLSVRSASALFSHEEGGSGDLRLILNRASEAATASMLFQTGFSGAAEAGLSGDGRFRIKVSADGTAWRTALRADPSTGRLSVGTEASPSMLTLASGDGAYPTALTIQEAQHAFSARAALALGAWLIGQDAAGLGVRNFFFYDSSAAITRGLIGAAGGLIWGNASGGDKGAGTLNAVAVYDDNALLSCYVFDQYLDGAVELEKWDERVPAQMGAHAPLRQFLARIGTGHDPLTLDGYARHWKEKRHLSSLPNEAGFDPYKGLSTGAWIQRLIETVEIHAILIEQLNQSLKRLHDAPGET